MFTIGRAVLLVFAEHGQMTVRMAERLPEFDCYGYPTIRKCISELHQVGLLTNVGTDTSRRSPATIYALVEERPT